MYAKAKEMILNHDNRAPIAESTLRAFMPAAYSTEAHSAVTRRYGFFPTYRIIETMFGAGYVPVEARNYQKKDKTQLAHTKHMLRFRQAGKPLVRDEIIPEIVLLNSHDRSSRFEMYAGFYRVLCANGMIVGTNDGQFVQPLVVKHSRNMVPGILQNVRHIAGNTNRTLDVIARMRALLLNPMQQTEYAVQACAEARPDSTLAIPPTLLLAPRRMEDAGDSLWHVVNRVQENLIKGGIAGTSPRGRRAYTAPATSIGSDMSVNTAVWNVAMRVISKASASSKAALEVTV